jgi:tRNA-Thr(GGU) m(6)t(6)A37 methyltransferase TsaA
MTSTPSEGLAVRPVGTVRTALRDVVDAPRQGDEGAPPARIDIDPAAAPALEGLDVGDRIIVLTWLHLADRTVQRTVPRDDPARPMTGVFATRSADRPNPIGLHPCVVRGIDAHGIDVDAIEAIDGTPVLDIKCALPAPGQR